VKERMLNKCISTKATLLVPDMEDSVPPEEKPKAREMIASKLKFIRDNTYSQRVVITPRTNGITTGLFQDDVKGVLSNQDAVASIDGFCVPKVDTPEELNEIDSFLAS
jgi:citrate lyase beta subunit